MTTTYSIKAETNHILRVAFGAPAGNDRIIQDAEAQLSALIQTGRLPGGKLLKINGPASMPVAMLLGHRLSHLYETLACFDPKLGRYVVVSSHGGEHQLGDLLK